MGDGRVHVSGPGTLLHQCSLQAHCGIGEYSLIPFRACKYIWRTVTIAGMNNHVREGG